MCVVFNIMSLLTVTPTLCRLTIMDDNFYNPFGQHCIKDNIYENTTKELKKPSISFSIIVPTHSIINIIVLF